MKEYSKTLTEIWFCWFVNKYGLEPDTYYKKGFFIETYLVNFKMLSSTLSVPI
jgi:hypothetical protein